MSPVGEMRTCKRCGRSVMRNQCRPSRKGGYVCLECLRARQPNVPRPESVAGRSGRRRRGPSQQAMGDAAVVVLVGLLAALMLGLYWALF
ncbi:MAG: hypothetical protein RLZZ126_7 [Pseudomonadota bacterium]|jgi:hypothetical protein